MATVNFEKIVLENKTILKRTFYGDLTITEVIDSFSHLLNNDLKDNSEIGIIITDVTEAKLNFNMREFRNMISFIKNDEILSKLRLAVVVNSPLKTVFPTLASTIIGVKVIPFSTMDGAIKWAINSY